MPGHKSRKHTTINSAVLILSQRQWKSRALTPLVLVTTAHTIKSSKSPHHLWQCCTYTKHVNYESSFLRLTHSQRYSPQTQTVWLTLKGEHKRMLSQKIGTFDRNNLNCHRHKQIQTQNVVLFCSELNTFTLLRDVSSIHFT